MKAHLALGERERAEALAGELEELLRAKPSDPTASGYVRALEQLGEKDKLLQVCRKLVEEFPTVVDIWRIYGLKSLVVGDTETGESALTTAIELIGNRFPQWRAGLMGRLGRAVAEHWGLFYEHDAEVAATRVVHGPKGYRAGDALPL